MLELDWLALGVAVKYQLPLDNSPQSTLMWKRHQAFSTHRRTLMSERLIKTPIRYYGEKVVVRNAYYKSDEPWVTFRDIRDLFPKDSNDFREVAGTTSYGITHWKHI